MRRFTLLPLLLAIVLVTPACSSSDDPTDPGQNGGTFTATIDGTPWTADVVAAANNGFTFGIEGTANGIEIAMSVNLAENTLPGTVDLTSGSVGAQLTEGSQTWFAVGQGGSGTLTLTTLTSSRAVGTFQMVGAPVANSATGTRVVTNGQFDVSF